ncbi:protein phosphatase, partial [Cystoisospora suis]
MGGCKSKSRPGKRGGGAESHEGGDGDEERKNKTTTATTTGHHHLEEEEDQQKGSSKKLGEGGGDLSSSSSPSPPGSKESHQNGKMDSLGSAVRTPGGGGGGEDCSPPREGGESERQNSKDNGGKSSGGALSAFNMSRRRLTVLKPPSSSKEKGLPSLSSPRDKKGTNDLPNERTNPTEVATSPDEGTVSSLSALIQQQSLSRFHSAGSCSHAGLPRLAGGGGGLEPEGGRDPSKDSRVTSFKNADENSSDLSPRQQGGGGDDGEAFPPCFSCSFQSKKSSFERRSHGGKGGGEGGGGDSSEALIQQIRREKSLPVLAEADDPIAVRARSLKSETPSLVKSGGGGGDGSRTSLEDEDEEDSRQEREKKNKKKNKKEEGGEGDENDTEQQGEDPLKNTNASFIDPARLRSLLSKMKREDIWKTPGVLTSAMLLENFLPPPSPPSAGRGAGACVVVGEPADGRQESYSDKLEDIALRPKTSSIEQLEKSYGFGFACKKGLKPESPNQDDFSLMRGEDFAIFGVFDGHGPSGHDVSAYVHRMLLYLLLTDDWINKNLAKALRNAFVAVSH